MSSEAPLAVDVRLDVDDIQLLVAASMEDPLRPDGRRRWALLRWLVRVTLVMAALLHPIVWVVVALEAGVLCLELQLRRKAVPARGYQRLDGRYSIEERGLLRRSIDGETLVLWSAVEQVSRTLDHLLIRFAGSCWVIPFRSFGSVADRDHYIATLQRHAGHLTIRGEDR